MHRSWASGGREALVLLALASLFGGCKPIENLEGCVHDTESTLTPDDMTAVDTAVSAASTPHGGSLVWTKSGDRSTVTVTVAQNEADPPSRSYDCDGNWQGYSVALEAEFTTSDLSILGQHLYFGVQLNRQAEIVSGDLQVEVPLDFERLKTMGEAPDGISDEPQLFPLTLVPPDMKPRDMEIFVAVPGSSNPSRSVSLGKLTFQ